MKTQRVICGNKNFQRWVSAALITVGGLVSNAYAQPTVSGQWQELYKTTTTDGSGNNTYSLDFHTTGATVVASPLSSIIGSVAEDLSVSYGSSGIANGSGGPVTLSQLVITQGANEATFDITGAILTSYTGTFPPGTSGGNITGGVATLVSATPTFLADLSDFHTSNFTAYYVGALFNSSASPAALASTGNAGFILTAAVPEPSSIVTTGIGVAILGGFLWRRRRAAVKSGVGSLAVSPC
jgi:hypothetical protein